MSEAHITLFQKIRVMLVDDHPCFREGIEALLRYMQDMEVVAHAGDGREAVRTALAIHPNVILMDIAMPFLNGIEAARQIVREEPHARVVFLSQHVDAERIRAVMGSGAVGYLTKQARIADIISAIREAHRGNPVVDQFVSAELYREYQRYLTTGTPFSQNGVPLTSRETEVLQLISEGFTNKAIAADLNISVKTVEKHRQSLMHKLNLHSTAPLTRYAIAHSITHVTKPEVSVPTLLPESSGEEVS